MKTDTKDLVKGLTKQLEVKQAEATRIADAFPVDEQGRFSIPTEMHRDYVRAVREGQEIKALIDAAGDHQGQRAWLDGDEQVPYAARDAASGPGRRDALEGKSLGDLFVESKAYQDARAGGFDNQPFIRSTIEGKSIWAMSAGTTTIQSLGSAQQLPMVELARRKWHIRDLFPKSTTKAHTLYGIRETGWENAAAQVRQRTAADGVSPAQGLVTDRWGRAPRSKLTLTPVNFPVAEIAHLLDAHKNILADESRLKTFINMRMVEGVKFAEDWDLLWSVGDGEKITGLFNTPGVQEYTGLASDKYDVQVRRAITKALIAEYDPSGLVISPTRFEQIETTEGSDGHLRVAVSVALGADKRVWRLPVVETTAMPDELFLLGAFGMGAQLHDRESVSVKVSSENGTNFEDGIVTFRADERVALEVARPESFVIGTWTTHTPD